MSVEKARAFVDRFTTEKQFRQELGSHTKAAWDSVLAVAKKHGYECTSKELHHALREKMGMPHAPSPHDDDEANCIFISPA